MCLIGLSFRRCRGIDWIACPLCARRLRGAARLPGTGGPFQRRAHLCPQLRALPGSSASTSPGWCIAAIAGDLAMSPSFLISAYRRVGAPVRRRRCLACAVLRGGNGELPPEAATNRGALAGMYRCHQPREGASP
jgi:hypothetical protein